jgi:hypothetical protein
MLHSFAFIGFLFCVGLAGLFLGGGAAYERADVHFNGRSATMQLADPGKKITLPAPGGIDVVPLDVRYSGPDGEIVVPQKWLSSDVARRLVNGEKIPVTYMKHSPNRIFYAGEKPDSPWGWLALGIAAMATFVYAYLLKRREP